MTKITKVRNIHTGEIRFYQDRKSANDWVYAINTKLQETQWEVIGEIEI